MSDGPAQLSCEQCKQGKKKCDKRVPCTACSTAGLDCRPVRRARLPRGRTGKVQKRNGALEDKVAKLEGLLQKIEAQITRDGNLASPESDGTPGEPPKGETHRNTKVEDFAARDFWMTLSSEVLGLRETLEESDEDSLPAEFAATSPQAGTGSKDSPHTLLFGHAGRDGPLSASAVTTPQTRDTLLQIYKQRVDIIFKILHWPTVLGLLEYRSSSNTAAVSALENAICYMALCSITDAECENLHLGERAALVERYQYVTEESIAAAQLLTTTDIVTLQAFLLYLSGLRCCMNGASTWTLLALAVRVADTCGLFAEDVRLSSFDIEQRRRLRSGIGFLDSQTAFGRGSLPLLSLEDLGEDPANINDSEMSRFGVQSSSSSSVTEMSFSCLCRRAMVTQRKLCDASIPGWQDRLAIVSDFENSVMCEFGHLDFSPDPFQRYVSNSARDMVSSISLLLRRPPYKNTGEKVPASDDFNVIDCAVRVLESGMFKANHEDFAPYRWFVWPKWYALAVLLIELLNVEGGASYEHAFQVAQQSYTGYANSATDAQSDLLWKPIMKLMRRVQQTRKTSLANTRGGQYLTSGPRTQDPTYSEPLDGPTSVSTRLPLYDSDGQANNGLGSTLGDMNMLDDAPWLQWDGFIDAVGDPLGPLQVTMM